MPSSCFQSSQISNPTFGLVNTLWLRNAGNELQRRQRIYAVQVNRFCFALNLRIRMKQIDYQENIREEQAWMKIGADVFT